jgi:hypothetical protein
MNLGVTTAQQYINRITENTTMELQEYDGGLVSEAEVGDAPNL